MVEDRSKAIFDDAAASAAVHRVAGGQALGADPPPGWLTQPGHLRYQAAAAGNP
jgi:hypothetical protein